MRCDPVSTRTRKRCSQTTSEAMLDTKLKELIILLVKEMGVPDVISSPTTLTGPELYDYLTATTLVLDVKEAALTLNSEKWELMAKSVLSSGIQ